MNKITLLTIFVAVAFGTGCAHPLSETYKPAGVMASPPRATALVVVGPEEGRPYGETSNLARGWVSLIPLAPIGPAQFFTPDRYYNVNFKGKNFKQDLGETIANDLRASGIAQDVRCVAKFDGFKTDPGQHAYTLDIKLREGLWHRHVACYGASVLASLVWIYGLPVSYGNVRLELEATLKDAGGNPIGNKTFKGSSSVYECIYFVNVFPGRLSIAYGQISRDMREFIIQSLAAKSNEKSRAQASGSSSKS